MSRTQTRGRLSKSSLTVYRGTSSHRGRKEWQNIWVFQQAPALGAVYDRRCHRGGRPPPQCPTRLPMVISLKTANGSVRPHTAVRLVLTHITAPCTQTSPSPLCAATSTSLHRVQRPTPAGHRLLVVAVVLCEYGRSHAVCRPVPLRRNAKSARVRGPLPAPHDKLSTRAT